MPIMKIVGNCLTADTEANRLSDAITLAEQVLAGPRDHVGAAQASFRLARLYGAADRHHDVLHTLQQSRTHHHAAGMPFPTLPTPNSRGHSTALCLTAVASAAISSSCGFTDRIRNHRPCPSST